MLKKMKGLLWTGSPLFLTALIFGTTPALAKTDNMPGETVSKSYEHVCTKQTFQSVENVFRVQTQNSDGCNLQENVNNSATVKQGTDTNKVVESSDSDKPTKKTEDNQSTVSNTEVTLHSSGNNGQAINGAQSITKEERQVIQQNFVNGIQTANSEFKTSRTQVLDNKKEAVADMAPKSKKSTFDSFKLSLEDLRIRMQNLKQDLVDGLKSLSEKF